MTVENAGKKHNFSQTKLTLYQSKNINTKNGTSKQGTELKMKYKIYNFQNTILFIINKILYIST